jgi:hypothetical protein
MPHWLVISLFIVLVAALLVIVRWEFSRAQDEPRSVSGAVKRYLDAEIPPARSHASKEIKRGFDNWD